MFFRHKSVGERSYLQIVESHRDGRSVRQHVVATRGRAEDRLDGTVNPALAKLTVPAV